MGTYTGTDGNNTITLDEVSEGVISVPAGSFPSDQADTINGKGGYDTLEGGGGNDAITFSGVSDVDGGAGNDQIRFYSPEGAPDPDGYLILMGGEGNDFISSQGWETTNFNRLGIAAYGEEGNDRLEALHVVTYSMGDEWDGGGQDLLSGGPGDDTYWVVDPSDLAQEDSGEGYDTVEAWDTSYTLGPNLEKLVVAPDDPGFGYSRLTGNSLNNQIIGGKGNDTLDGGAGNDTLRGMDGGDTVFGGLDNDTIKGGNNNDWLNGQWGNDTILGDAGDDTIIGEDGTDRLFGGNGNDWFTAGDKDDQLFGQNGNDEMYGDAGNDRLTGGAGLDKLGGGGGNDTFDYNAVTESEPGAGRDVVLDFAGVGAAAGDRVDLSTIDANTGVGDNQAFAFKGTGAITGAGQVHVVASGTNTLIQANTGGTIAPELEILVKDGAATPAQWVAGDFIL
jgi:Ca2+-binding RTX toxin-like protein